MCKWCLQPWVMTWSESQASVCMSCNVAGDRHAEHTSERVSERGLASSCCPYSFSGLVFAGLFFPFPSDPLCTGPTLFCSTQSFKKHAGLRLDVTM